jgi:hypothetical protein
MLNFAIQGLSMLNHEMPTILGEKMDHQTYKLAIVKYFELSHRFCINSEDANRLKEAITEKVL